MDLIFDAVGMSRRRVSDAWGRPQAGLFWSRRKEAAMKERSGLRPTRLALQIFSWAVTAIIIANAIDHGRRTTAPPEGAVASADYSNQCPGERSAFSIYRYVMGR
jgi:hypothetical protein